MKQNHININMIDACVFDFDGVLTNNLVHLDRHGDEWVSCNRADGLAFDLLHKLNKPTYILSTEKNHENRKNPEVPRPVRLPKTDRETILQDRHWIPKIRKCQR